MLPQNANDCCLSSNDVFLIHVNRLGMPLYGGGGGGGGWRVASEVLPYKKGG